MAAPGITTKRRRCTAEIKVHGHATAATTVYTVRSSDLRVGLM